jgi:hypothetical protein
MLCPAREGTAASRFSAPFVVKTIASATRQKIFGQNPQPERNHPMSSYDKPKFEKPAPIYAVKPAPKSAPNVPPSPFNKNPSSGAVTGVAKDEGGA